MKKKILSILVLGVVAVTSLVGCGQYGAKEFGGSYTVNLPKGQKLSEVTWKESDLWYLTKPMTEKDVAETYQFKEDSTFGVMEGTVTIIESK